MALALPQIKSNSDETRTFAPNITLDSAPAPGQLMVCMGWCFFDTAAPVVGTGYTTIAIDTTNHEYSWVLVYRVAQAGESATQNPWTQGLQPWGLTMYVFSGQAAGTTAINGFSTKEVLASSVTCTGVTPSVPGCVGLTSGGALGGTNVVEPSGWTSDGTISGWTWDHLANLPAGTSQTPTYSWTTPTDYVEGVLVVVAPAPASTPWIGA